MLESNTFLKCKYWVFNLFAVVVSMSRLDGCFRFGRHDVAGVGSQLAERNTGRVFMLADFQNPTSDGRLSSLIGPRIAGLKSLARCPGGNVSTELTWSQI